MSTKTPRWSGAARSRRGEKIGPYRIDQQLGRGAMGEVFRAFDQRLDRWVALKHIRPKSEGEAASRKRFLHEARAAARLNHPAIVQVHDILQEPEGDFIVMELAEGRSLDELLSGGPLPVPVALAYGADLAAGLAAAHAEGVVHRDLKKENIVVTPTGRPKILDFGLAKDLQPHDDSVLSREGQVIGTPRAMSPEQVRGQKVDSRADLFALGSLLYEMVTGVVPFDGFNAAEALEKVCGYSPPPPSHYAEVPAAVDRLVLHLLEKSPSARPQTAGWVQAEMRKLLAEVTGDDDMSSLAGLPHELDAEMDRTGRRFVVLTVAFLGAIAACFLWLRPWGMQGEEVVAVARFQTLGSDDRDFFSDALGDGIAHQLSTYGGIETKRLGDPSRRALDGVGAVYLVHGLVQWSFDERVKVQPELTRVIDGTVLWSEAFYASVDDLGRLQDEVAMAITGAVEKELGRRGGDQLHSEEPAGPAERYRFRARIAASGDRREDLIRAADLLRTACDLAPGDAAVWADLAEVLAASRRRGLVMEPSVLAAAGKASTRALEMAPDSPRAWRASGSVLAARGDLKKALETYRMASAKATGELRDELRRLSSWVLRRQGDPAGARRLLLESVGDASLPPVSAAALINLEAELVGTEEARERLGRALRVDPGHPRLAWAAARLALAEERGPGAALDDLLAAAGTERPQGRLANGAALLALSAGRPAVALDLLDGAVPLAYGDERLLPRELLRAWALGRLGRRSRGALDSARSHLEAEMALVGDARSVVALAMVSAELGEPARARELLAKALNGEQFRGDAVVGHGVAVDAAAVLDRLGDRDQASRLRSEPGRTSSPVARLLEEQPPW
ncbi:MAG: protein kinase [Acidobacteriota bacterium]